MEPSSGAEVSVGAGSDAPPFWSLKPWWCQPWSLLLTGTAAVAGSWWLLHRLWFTAVVALLVGLWWLLFLLFVPAAHRGALAPTTGPVPPLQR